MSWRYDPIFISQKYSVSYHIERFEQMAEDLQGYTRQCVVSFIDLYEKTKRNFPQARSVTAAQQEQLIETFSKIAALLCMSRRRKWREMPAPACWELTLGCIIHVDMVVCIVMPIMIMKVSGQTENCMIRLLRF